MSILQVFVEHLVGKPSESEKSLRPEGFKRLKCDQMQGYLFSKPIPGAEMERLLASSPKS